MQIKNYTYILAIIIIFMHTLGTQCMATRRSGNLLCAVESGSLEDVQQVQFSHFPMASIIDALEIAVIHRNFPIAHHILSAATLPLNMYLSRLENPLIPSNNKAVYTLLETALIYHEDTPDKNNLSIIKLLFANRAKMTPLAKCLAQMPGKESAASLFLSNR